MGADRVLAPEAVDPDESASDVVIEAVGRPGLLGAAMAHARMGATVVALGFCMAADPITPAMASKKELTFKFPMGWTRRASRGRATVGWCAGSIITGIPRSNS